jgi:hypothetical protein
MARNATGAIAFQSIEKEISKLEMKGTQGATTRLEARLAREAAGSHHIAAGWGFAGPQTL